MADIQTWIRTRLRGFGDITSRVSTRIRSNNLKQNEPMPAIAVHVVSNVPHENINENGRLFDARIAVRCYDDDGVTAGILADAVRNQALRPTTRGEIDGVFINEVSLETGPFTDSEPPIDGSDQWQFSTRQDFRIWYRD